METPEEQRIRIANYYAKDAKDMIVYMIRVAREASQNDWPKEYKDFIENIWTDIKNDIDQLVECSHPIKYIS